MSNDICGVVVPTSRVAYATSAGTAGNATNLNGLAASSYVTNGGATVNGSAISNGAAITTVQTVILKPTTNHSAAATTSTYLSQDNITTLKSASWASGGSAVSNTIVELGAGQYLINVHGSLVQGGTTIEGRILMQSVIGGVTSLVAFTRIVPASAVVAIPSYNVAGAYVSSSVPVGITFSMYGSAVITNNAAVTTFSFQRQ
jgi:hypothetical protein